MLTLGQLQVAFAAAVTDNAAAPSAACLFADDSASALQGLAIYRGSVQAKVERALSAAYPITAQIVGGAFFAAMASAYAKSTPSTHADLNCYGAEFSAFLESFEHAQNLPYLPDVARMEWLMHRAHYAGDAAPFDAAALVALPPDAQEHLRLTLHPAVGLLASPYPLTRIRDIHQPGYAGSMEVEPAVETQYVLVSRPRFRVEVDAIGAGSFAFLEAHTRGESLTGALTAALAADPRFDLAGSLPTWVANRVVTNFVSPQG
jgi:uncharacterized protein